MQRCRDCVRIRVTSAGAALLIPGFNRSTARALQVYITQGQKGEIMPKGKGKHKKEESTKQQNGALRKAPAGELPESITPGSLVRRFLDEVDRLAEDFGILPGFRSSLERGLPCGAWSPQVAMFERDGELVRRT